MSEKHSHEPMIQQIMASHFGQTPKFINRSAIGISKKLHKILKKGIHEAKKGKTRRLTIKDLEKWNKMVDDA